MPTPSAARPLEAALLAAAWSSLTGETGGPPLDRLAVGGDGAAAALPSRFPVAETAIACVGTALLAAAALHDERGGGPTRVGLDRGHVAAAVRSERYFRQGTASTGMGFAPLSRFWRAADGWVRTHANYRWHRDALLSVLGVPADADAVAAAIASRPASAVEDEVFAAGGIAAAVRGLDEWRAHEQGRAVAAEPLIGHEALGSAPPRTRASGTRPAAGVRVLDLTRVIAGPVCTRYLAALGAEVLRLDPPGRLDMARGEPADTLLGKRSALLDVATADGSARLHDLLDGADVLVAGYRPGALDRFGLTPATLAERHPGLVVVVLDAWGHRGPWAGRRGFDSVVQGPTGIAMGEADPAGDVPGALPCQLLDHGTGYLAAAAALDGVRRQRRDGGTHVRRLSLARTAAWLTSGSADPSGGATGGVGHDATPWLAEWLEAAGTVTALLPPGSIDGQALRWPVRLTRYGTDDPSWSAVAG